MHDTARLAGFFAAHGIWSVSEGATLIPMLGFEHADGGRGMDRFVTDDIGDGANTGMEALHRNQRSAARAVLVVDGYVHLEYGKTDSLIVSAMEYGASGLSMTVAVPYRPQPSPLGFAIYHPKFLEISGVEPDDYQTLGEAFFDGVDSHENAAEIWNAHYDPSV